MLPWYDVGELGSHHERIRKVLERLRSIPVFRFVVGAVVPQYFVSGRR